MRPNLGPNSIPSPFLNYSRSEIKDKGIVKDIPQYRVSLLPNLEAGYSPYHLLLINHIAESYKELQPEAEFTASYFKDLFETKYLQRSFLRLGMLYLDRAFVKLLMEKDDLSIPTKEYIPEEARMIYEENTEYWNKYWDGVEFVRRLYYSMLTADEEICLPVGLFSKDTNNLTSMLNRKLDMFTRVLGSKIYNTEKSFLKRQRMLLEKKIIKNK